MAKNKDEIEIKLDKICLDRNIGARTVEHTPLAPSAYLGEFTGGNSFLKAGNFTVKWRV